MRGLLKQRLGLLANPEQAFTLLKDTTLERAVADHLKLLAITAILATVVEFCYITLRAVYVNIFYTVDVQYLRMLNYALSQAGGIGLFYIVAGTLLVLVLSFFLRFFVRLKYTRMLTVLLLSLTPLLLFGWLPVVTLPLGIWVLFIFVIGIRTQANNG